VVRVFVIANGIKAVARHGTHVVSMHAVKKLTTSANGTATTVLLSAVTPPVGGVLAVNATATSPGVLGRVVKRTTGHGGTVTLVTTPVPLNQAFSAYELAYSASVPTPTNFSGVYGASNGALGAVGIRPLGLFGGLPLAGKGVTGGLDRRCRFRECRMARRRPTSHDNARYESKL
jgi:hypothetical protein